MKHSFLIYNGQEISFDPTFESHTLTNYALNYYVRKHQGAFSYFKQDKYVLYKPHTSVTNVCIQFSISIYCICTCIVNYCISFSANANALNVSEIDKPASDLVYE